MMGEISYYHQITNDKRKNTLLLSISIIPGCISPAWQKPLFHLITLKLLADKFYIWIPYENKSRLKMRDMKTYIFII
jgi:hypothetical protein